MIGVGAGVGAFHEIDSEGGSDELSLQDVVVHPLIPRL